MRLQQVTVSSATTSAPIPLDREAGDFSVGLAIIVSGTNTSKVQYTLDNVFDPTVTPNWIDHATLTGVTSNSGGNIAFNVTAVRLNVTAFTNGTATLQVLQSKPGA